MKEQLVGNFQKFGMLNCKPSNTPMDANIKLGNDSTKLYTFVRLEYIQSYKFRIFIYSMLVSSSVLEHKLFVGFARLLSLSGKPNLNLAVGHTHPRKIYQ